MKKKKNNIKIHFSTNVHMLLKYYERKYLLLYFCLFTDQTYANILLDHAKQLYEFATQFKGKYSDSVNAAAAYYR